MRFEGDKSIQNFPDELLPLFEAMMNDQTIPSITVMSGRINKDNPEKDRILTNVKAESYWQSMMCTQENATGKWISHDLIDAGPHEFYMSWVRSFTL